MREAFTCFKCVDDMFRLGVEPWRGLILEEGRKIEFLGIIRGSSLVQICDKLIDYLDPCSAPCT